MFVDTVGTTQKAIFAGLGSFRNQTMPRLKWFTGTMYDRMSQVLEDPNRNLRKLQIELGFPYQMVVEKCQEALNQFTWTPGKPMT